MKPKFSWEPLDGGSLLFKVTIGGKEITWKWTKRTTNDDLYQMLGEVMMEVMPLEPMTPETRMAFQAGQRTEALKASQSNEQTEDDSQSQLAAKAASVTRTGRSWYSNLEDGDDDLPLYEIGHGEPE